MRRLILVPQFPVKMRYQEWWWDEFPRNLGPYFDETVVLGGTKTILGPLSQQSFSVLELAADFEMEQIREYIGMKLYDDDVLLLNDLSFPGLFANVLFHKKPKRCFAICHATSKNRYDYFSKVRKSKYGVEKSTAKLFDWIIVGSKYHMKKLGWSNIAVLPLPLPIQNQHSRDYRSGIVCVSRTGTQKVTRRLERLVEKEIDCNIVRVGCDSWHTYYQRLSKFKVMLITSKEETFGYQVVDAMISGCIPIAPNAYSYPELLPAEYLYSSQEAMLHLVNKGLRGRLPQLERLNNSEESSVFFNRLAGMMI